MKQVIYPLILSMSFLSALLYGAAVKEKKETIPYTLSLYNEASEKQIAEASEASIKAIGTWGFIHPIHKYENASKVICHLAQLVCDKYPHNTIFALGQSPAYIIEVARLLHELNGDSSERFHNITFSSKWWVKGDNGFGPKKRLPTKEEIAFYRNYLTSVGISPEKIIKKKKENGLKTIVVDYTFSGAGMYSFLELLANWSKEEGTLDALSSSLEAFLLQDNEAKSDEVDLKIMHHIPIVKHRLIDEHQQVMYPLAQSDYFKDRLVPYYPYYRWLAWKLNLGNYTLPENAKYVLFELIKYIMTVKSKK